MDLWWLWWVVNQSYSASSTQSESKHVWRNRPHSLSSQVVPLYKDGEDQLEVQEYSERVNL